MATWNYIGTVIEPSSIEEINLKLSDGRKISQRYNEAFWYSNIHQTKNKDIFRQFKMSNAINQKIEITVEDGIAVSYKKLPS